MLHRPPWPCMQAIFVQKMKQLRWLRPFSGGRRRPPHVTCRHHRHQNGPSKRSAQHRRYQQKHCTVPSHPNITWIYILIRDNDHRHGIYLPMKRLWAAARRHVARVHHGALGAPGTLAGSARAPQRDENKGYNRTDRKIMYQLTFLLNFMHEKCIISNLSIMKVLGTTTLNRGLQ